MCNTSDTEEKRVEGAVRNGIGFYATLQMEDGHWPGDYGDQKHDPEFALATLISDECSLVTVVTCGSLCAGRLYVRPLRLVA